MKRGPLARVFLVLALLGFAGLGATPALAGSVSMAWDPVSDLDLAGYRVFYSSTAGAYDQQLDVGLVTQTTLTGLTDCTTWYVAVKAMDDVGNLSAAYSNEISGWPRPTATGVAPASAEQGRQLDLVISGSNFNTGASLLFDIPGITVNTLAVNGCGELLANVTVTNSAAVGATGISVVNADQTFGAGAGLFTVVAAVAPTVQSTSPPDGASGVSAAVQPSITFSEPLNPATVTAAAVQLIDSGGGAIAQAAGSPSLSGNGLTVTITPAARLALGATYRLRAVGGAGGVTDLAGHPLASTFTQATGFNTEADSVPPVVSTVSSGSLTGTSGQISWTTDEPADSQVFYRALGQTAYQQTAVDPGLVTSHSVLLQGLMPTTTYEYHVRSVDAGGNVTVSSPDDTFTTGASSSSYLVFEAEGGALTSPMRASTGTGAFGNAWIDTPAGTSQGTSNNPAGTAVFGINVPTSGTWYLWVRLLNVGGTGGTMYESVDAAGRQLMNVTAADVWQWSAGRSYVLSAGQHSLELGGRRAQARADRILLTNDPAFVPTDQAVGDVTPPTAPAGLTVTPTDQANVLAWNNPADSDLDRIVIRVSVGGAYPTSPVDGLAVGDLPATPGDAGSATHGGLTNGNTYRYSVFAIDTAGNVSLAAQAEGVPFDNQPPSDVLNLRRTDLYTGP